MTPIGDRKDISNAPERWNCDQLRMWGLWEVVAGG